MQKPVCFFSHSYCDMVTQNNHCFCLLHIVADKLSETVHLMSNDPSMGLYRIQEHVKKSVPTLVEKKVKKI